MSSIASPSAGVARQPRCAGVALLLELELPASHSSTLRLPRPSALGVWPIGQLRVTIEASPSGPVAQLGARMNGIHEVTGSIPVWSTTLSPSLSTGCK